MSIYTLLRKPIPLKYLYSVISASLLFMATAFVAAHAEGELGLSDLAKNIQSHLGAVENLIVSLAYIGGAGFGVAALMKFKQYKDNPQQVQLGQPISLAAIAIALLFFPQVVKIFAQTAFNSTGGQGSSNYEGGIFQ